MMDSLTKTLASIGQGVSKSLESGVNSVRTKLNDPNLQKEVKEKAAAGWSWLSSTATTLWSAAKETASTIASELADDGIKKPNSPRPSVPAAYMKEERVRDRENMSAKETIRTDRTPVEERHYSDGNEDVEDEDDWMEREMKKAKWDWMREVRNRENLKISDKKSSSKDVSSVKTTTTSDGLKIGIEEPSKRHHSHHRSHHHSHGRG